MVSCLKSSLEKRLSRHFSDENYIMSWSAIYVPSIKLHWYKNPEEEEEKLSNIRKSRTEILITLQSDLEDSSPQKKIDESLLFSFMTPTRPPKNYHSIIVQGICKFMNIVSKWPGSTHDSFILRISAYVWEWCRSRRLAFWE